MDSSADGHCRINVHMRGASLWNVARASQAQLKDGVSVIVHNCMRTRERSVGGSAWKLSEYGATLIVGLSDTWEMMMDSSKSGPLSAMKLPRLHVTEQCDRVQKHPANGFWIVYPQTRTSRRCLGQGTTPWRKSNYPG